MERYLALPAHSAFSCQMPNDKVGLRRRHVDGQSYSPHNANIILSLYLQYAKSVLGYLAFGTKKRKEKRRS